MRIGGFQKFSMIDFPGKLAAVVFTQGCNFRCAYCYNPELVYPERFEEQISEDEILSFLKQRKDCLNGVVITGGEPTIHMGLIPFMQSIKELGYPIRLNTNGSNPEMIREVLHLKLADYIAMDIKAPLEHYDALTCNLCNIQKLQESIYLIINSELDHEFRTVMVKPYCTSEDIPAILSTIKGANKYIIQEFVPSEKILDESLISKNHYTKEEVHQLKERWEQV